MELLTIRVMSGRAKSMCFAAEGMVAGMGCKTLAGALTNSTLAVFALFIQISIRAGVIEVQTISEAEIYHGAGTGSKTLVQCRNTILIETGNLSRCKSVLAGNGAYPGTIRSRILIESMNKLQKL